MYLQIYLAAQTKEPQAFARTQYVLSGGNSNILAEHISNTQLLRTSSVHPFVHICDIGSGEQMTAAEVRF